MDTQTSEALRRRADALDYAASVRANMTYHRDSVTKHSDIFLAAVADAREAGCTMAEIAAAVGMSRQGLYHAIGEKR